MRITRLLIAAALFAAVGYAGYTMFLRAPAPGGSVAAKGPVSVEVATVKTGKLEVAIATVGTLKANEALIIRPEIAGRIASINFTEGAPAKKGDLLIGIDDRVFAAEVKQAEAQLNLASVNYARAKLLKEKGAGTVSNFDTMSATLRVAQAQVDLVRATLDKTRIVAPFDGVMGLRRVSPGDYVNPGQELVDFQSKNPIKAEFTLPENATRVVAVDQTIDVTVDALPNRTFTGKVYAIDPQINEANHNITLRAYIPNEDNTLNPGMFARVSIITSQKDNALLVPESAIIPRGNDSFAMRVGSDKKVTTVMLAIGERKNGAVEIVSGLAAGDIVVTAGQIKLRDGQEVAYTLATDAVAP